MEAPEEAMPCGAALEPASVVMEEEEVISRKRARTAEARRKFRIVASAIVACGRFQFVLEVQAEKAEQAQREIIESLENLGRHSMSEESVDAPTTRNQGLCTTYPGAEGGVMTVTNATNDGSHYIPNITTDSEESQQYEQPDEDLVTVPYRTNYETFSVQNHVNCSVGRPNNGHYQQNEWETLTVPSATNGYLQVQNQDHSTIERNETMPYEQEVWKFLDKPDLPPEELGTSALEFPSKVASRRWGSDQDGWEALQNLTKMDGKTEHWATLASELNDEMTRKIQELVSGSGRAKVQKLYKDTEDISKRIIGPGSDGKKAHKMQPKATSNTWPSVKEVGQYVSEIFEKLKSYVNELTTNMDHGRQKQASSLTAMARLIEDGRKALSSLGRGADWISDKLSTVQKDLKSRELTVDRHFQKCAEVLPTLVEWFLNERKGNFISVSTLINWYFEEMSFRTPAKEASSASSDFDHFFSDI